MSTNKMTTGVFIRRSLLNDPEMTFDDLIDQWDASGLPKSKIPSDSQTFYNSRYTLKKKYGVSDLNKIGRGKTGVYPGSLLRLLLAIHPDLTQERAQFLLAQDGIELNEVAWAQRNKNKSKTPSKTDASPDSSPDPNQNAGPRARVVKKKKKVVVRVSPEVKVDARQAVVVKYEAIEEQLDDLLAEAKALENLELVQQLRAVRRTVILKESEFVGK